MKNNKLECSCIKTFPHSLNLCRRVDDIPKLIFTQVGSWFYPNKTD